jgi:glycosyltransferase involved in cell wall biosynthesis
MIETNSSRPSVSVVVPAFNASSFITEALDSVFAQSAVPRQVIVVDDGSLDGTADKVRGRYGADVTVLQQSNAGPAAARNRGIAEANCDFIAFLDADDLWTPDKISRQIEFLNAHPECGLICSDMVDFGPDGDEGQSHFEKHGLGRNFFGDDTYVKDPFAKILSNNFISTPTVIARRGLVQESGGFPEPFRYAEDYLLWLQLARQTVVGYQPAIFVRRRRHENNLTNPTIFQLRNRLNILDYILKQHSDYLSRSGMSLRTRYGAAWFQLGYHQVYHGQRAGLSEAFWKSFCFRPSLRTAFYLAVALSGLTSVCVRCRQILQRRQ